MERKGVRVCSFSESYFPECGTFRLFGQREAACSLVCEHGVVWEEGEGGWWLGVSTLQQQAFCGSGDKHKHRAAVSILFSLRGQSQITAPRLRESVRVSNLQVSISTLQIEPFRSEGDDRKRIAWLFFFPFAILGSNSRDPSCTTTGQLVRLLREDDARLRRMHPPT